MTIIKIYDNGKIWDADNRNVKPIQDGLIHGKVIKDDNIYCLCYMVQGYYSDKPYAEVYVLPTDEISKRIEQADLIYFVGGKQNVLARIIREYDLKYILKKDIIKMQKT